MRFCLLLNLAIAFAVQAQPPVAPKDSAAAALALAKAQREREHARAMTTASGCYTDKKLAYETAKKTGRKLYLFVGFKCEDRPELAVELRKDGVLCHLDSQAGDSMARVSVIGKDGWEYYVPRPKIAGDTAERLRRAYDKSDPNPPRKDVGLSEEVKAKARCATCGAGCTCYGECICDQMNGVRTYTPTVITYAPTPTYYYVPAAPRRGVSAGFQYQGPLGGSFSAGACAGGS